MKYEVSVQMTYTSDKLYDTPWEAFLEMQSMLLNGEIEITIDNTSQINIQTEQKNEEPQEVIYEEAGY